MTTETALAKALRILDDLPDAELIEVASVIEEDAKRALERRDRARGALLRRMHERNAKALADADGSIAVEIGERNEYEWDGDALNDAIGIRDRDKFLKWVEGKAGYWAPRSVRAINNLIDKLGEDPLGARLAKARRVVTTEYVKFVDQS